jgi:hypothetical protein
VGAKDKDIDGPATKKRRTFTDTFKNAIKPFIGKGTPTKLVVRARGFETLYNKDLPLNLIGEFFDRPQFASSVSGINFKSELLRQESMRPICNLSSIEVNIETEEQK